MRTNHILVVLPGPMGDAILSGPALRQLRKGLPDSQLTFLGSEAACHVLKGVPWADNWLCADRPSAGLLRGRGFDAAILLRNSFRSAMMVRLAGIRRVVGYDRDGRRLLLSQPVQPFRLGGDYVPMSMLKYYGFLADEAIRYFGGMVEDEVDSRLELFTSERDRAQVDELFTNWKISAAERLVIMVPGGAFGPSKWWAPERFAALAEKLHKEQGVRVVISCAPTDAEQQLAEAVCLKATEELRRLPYGFGLCALKELVRRSALMVSNDTGPCHIAAAFGTPLVTMFGPTDSRWTATGYEKEIRLRIDMGCSPCQRGTCSIGHHCMEQITVAAVYEAAVQQLTAPTVPMKKQSLVGSYYAPYCEDFVPLRDGSGLVHQDYKAMLEQNRLGTLAEALSYEQGQALVRPDSGHREQIRVVLRGHEQERAVLYLKRYGRPGWRGLLQQWWGRRSRDAAGACDFGAYVQLAQSGIGVPRPVAYGQEKTRYGGRRSFVMREELPGAEALERLLPQWQEAQERYELLRDKKKLVTELAELVRALHGNGYCHRDLYLSHIFLCKDQQGRERLCLIDLQRVFQPKLCPGRWRVKDLAQLYYSGQGYFSRVDVVRFLRVYLGEHKLSGEAKQLAGRVERKAARISHHDPKKRVRVGKASR